MCSSIISKIIVAFFDVVFVNIIQAEDVFENPISYSRCEYCIGDDQYRLTVNNGRVMRAHVLKMTVTEQDFFVIRHFYRWERCVILNFRRYEKGLLPEAFAKSILKLYVDKTELKDVPGKELDYQLSKGRLNACYGMTVTDIVREIISYEDEAFTSTEPNLEEAIHKYNNSKRRFLYYPWGVWVTSYARYNLFTGIASFGEDYIYSDTDSIKAVNFEKHEDYIKRYNESVVSRLTRIAQFRGWSPDSFSPKNKYGKSKTLGVWNDEGVYDQFKTLGAKRYLTRKGDKYEITVAGLGKEAGRDYILEQDGDPFDFFTEGMYIPAGRTGKQDIFYGDNPITGNLTDYLGNICEYHEESYIHMQGTDYTLTFADGYINLLKGISEHDW